MDNDFWTCPKTGDTLFTCAQSGRVRNLTKERAIERHQSKQIRLASEYLRRDEIDRICAKHELEPDEFYTAAALAAIH